MKRNKNQIAEMLRKVNGNANVEVEETENTVRFTITDGDDIIPMCYLEDYMAIAKVFNLGMYVKATNYKASCKIYYLK